MMPLAPNCLFNFFDIIVRAESHTPELITRLQADFGPYCIASSACNPHLVVRGESGDLPMSLRPADNVRGLRSKNAIIFSKRGLRICDYFGEGWSVFDFTENTGEIYSPNIHRLHEIAYLLILSRVGKFLDLQGWHRLHGLGVARGSAALLLMLPMGGGKTTLLTHLAGRPGIKVLSDDTPLVNTRGQVRAFAIRAGITPDRIDRLPFPRRTDWYALNRLCYGTKHLIPIEHFGADISAQIHSRIILASGLRANGQSPLGPSRLRAFFAIITPLVTEFIIGKGTPVMREYFIENSLRDYFSLIRIACSRIIAALQLLRYSEWLQIELTDDPHTNAEILDKLPELR